MFRLDIYVVIGLVFFYLLLSLLASAIQEFIAAIFKLRSKTLVKSIEELLNQVDDSHAENNTRSFAGALGKPSDKQEYKNLYMCSIDKYIVYHFQVCQIVLIDIAF